MRGRWVWLLLPLALRALANGVVSAQGFIAISDDDFARVVIAQEFAQEPRLDASGSSWLPFPFWFTGAAMALWGTDIAVARALSWVTSLFSVLGVFTACRWLGSNNAWSLLAACGFAVLPHAVWLGLATVPEGYTAVLALLALASLCRPEPLVRTLGVLCLIAATLSRYETWPLVLVVGGFNLFDALRASTARDWHARAYFGLLSALSPLGPLAWLAHGYLTYAEPLFFLQKVAAYRQALGQAPQAWLDVLGNYPLALVLREPETFTFGICALIIWLVRTPSAGSRDARSGIIAAVRLLSGLSAVLVFLVVGDCLNGAPTHHPERALLVCWLVVLVLGCQTFSLVAPPLRTIAIVGALSAVASLLRGLHPPTHFMERTPEVALGRALASELSETRRLFLETDGYGYLAIMAGTGRPWLVVARNPNDPRQTEDVWRSPSVLRRFLDRHSVGWLAVYKARWRTAAQVAHHEKEVAGLALFRVYPDEENSDVLGE